MERPLLRSVVLSSVLIFTLSVGLLGCHQKVVKPPTAPGDPSPNPQPPGPPTPDPEPPGPPAPDPEPPGPYPPEGFFVDPARGSDENDGSFEQPFKTLQHACDVVRDRVEAGILGDDIYLRAGVYRMERYIPGIGSFVVCRLEGTPDDPAMISAMPAFPDTPGAVQRKSGRWYERVVFDDSSRITKTWKRVDGLPHVWKVHLELPKSYYNWPPIDDIFGTNDLNIAPAMMLQDGRPLLWGRSPKALTQPGMRYYDAEKGNIYIRSFDDTDPNTTVIEMWPTAKSQKSNRQVFAGTYRYAVIRGMEFRLIMGVTKPQYEDLRYDGHTYPNLREHVTFEDFDSYFLKNHFMHERSSNVAYWTIRNARIYGPPREVLQISGPGHVFQNNLVIQPHPLWSPLNIAGVMNLRRMPEAAIRGNAFYGNGRMTPRQLKGGTIVQFELYPKHREPGGPDAATTYGVRIENNLFFHNKGIVISLGKGCTRMRNIAIRGNVFYDHERSAIQVYDAQKNLVIEHNTFYGTDEPVSTIQSNRCTDHALGANYPSTVRIRRNIFAHTQGKALGEKLTNPGNPEDKITIKENLFVDSPPLGKKAITAGSAGLRDPAGLDFRPRANSPAVRSGHDIGAYDRDTEAAPGTDWWNLGPEFFERTVQRSLP